MSGRMSARWSGAATLLALLAAAGCAVAPGGGGPSSSDPSGSDLPLPPPGHGTLRQDEVSIAMRSGDLQIKVTPLMEPVLRAAAPDTYRRLAGLVETQGAAAAQAAGGGSPDLFLVSFFSDRQGTTFEPEALNLVSRGLRLRPDAVVPVTPGWGSRRLDQRETEMAVYAFLGEVDLESQLVVLYGALESAQWSVIRPRVRAELERARARAGPPGGQITGAAPDGAQSSSSYLEILR